MTQTVSFCKVYLDTVRTALTPTDLQLLGVATRSTLSDVVSNKQVQAVRQGFGFLL